MIIDALLTIVSVFFILSYFYKKLWCKIGLHYYDCYLCPCTTHLKYINKKGLFRYQKMHKTCKRCGKKEIEEYNFQKCDSND